MWSGEPECHCYSKWHLRDEGVNLTAGSLNLVLQMTGFHQRMPFSAVPYRVCIFCLLCYFCLVCFQKGSSSSSWPLTHWLEDGFGLLVSGTSARFIECATTPSLGFRNSYLVVKLINFRSYLEPKDVRRPVHMNIRNTVFLSSLDYKIFDKVSKVLLVVSCNCPTVSWIYLDYFQFLGITKVLTDHIHVSLATVCIYN